MVDYTKQTGTQLDGMIAFDPGGIGTEWAHLVMHIQADWKANVDNAKWGGDLSYKISVIANQLANGLTGFPQAVAPGSMPPDGSTPVTACVDLVSASFTSSGAQQMIAGLSGQGVQAGAAAISDIATKAAQKAVGSVMADSAKVIQDVGGALTATGVGAVIGVAASLVGGVLGALFGTPSYPFSVGACGLNTKPNIVSKYVYTYGTPVDGGPGNPNWRHFPDRARRGDAPWFGARNGPSDHMGVVPESWWWDGSRVRPHNDEWYACYSYAIVGGDAGTRPIDHAMYDNGQDGAYGGTVAAADVSVFRQLEQELLARAIVGIPAADFADFRRFQEAFIRAWKQNREFELNGCKAQPDWKILDKVISIWNQANAPQDPSGRPATLRIPAPSSQPQMLSWNPKDKPPATMPSYIQYLIYRYNNSMQSVQGSDGAIVLNMGKINDVTVGGLIPAGSIHLIAIKMKQKPAVAKKIKLMLPNSPQAWASLAAAVAALPASAVPKPKRRYFFGATLTGVAAGALAGGPVGAVAGAAAGGAVDLLRARHEKEGKWL